MNEGNTRKKVIIGIIVAIIVVIAVVIYTIFVKNNNLNKNTNNDLEKPKAPASTPIEDRPTEN